jgi:hypothetical protein
VALLQTINDWHRFGDALCFGPTQTYEIPHGLAYNPNYLIYHTIDGVNWYSGFTTYSLNAAYNLQITPYTTTSVVGLSLAPVTLGAGTWPSTTVQIRYTIYEDSSE